ncbi:MAG: dihydrolipoyl dehydrogenase [Flavobacteriales bacterium]|jgi:dihydrolipoamide dehydrogenase|nr:dihydrolipoyl dehydrogenase [Flavobacteriales bacterium]MDA8994623.1 dihydrolipoyl dehydrogenase [Schleiferiaceae bacterium]MDP4616971.1 dihydrolipoyl dehydrogenase [Schleiferiaceae bacterium]MDP4758539.1 dihydrolipoyl dehydrogenase [Schleiferiaceae bacterium]
MSSYDVVVIGSGPGGYVSAIRCAQLGMKTALVEKYATLGGTCLNVGCIPSKALLDSSEHYHAAVHSFESHGIQIDPPKIDFAKMIERKAGVVSTTCDGIDYLMNKNNIDVLRGFGSLKDKNTVVVAGDETTEVSAKHIILATGSKPIELPFAKFDKERVISSTEALSLKEIPKHMVVIGGGVIGLELGSVYKRLGAEVTIVEYAPSIIPTMDGAMGKELMRSLKKIGMKFSLSTKVSNVSRDGDVVTVTATNKKGEEVTFEGDYCLVAVGRGAYTAKLGLENVGIATDERGRIAVNDHLQTAVPNIYAIGDVVRGAMLAHKAEEEGVFVAESIAGEKPHINYNLIPGIVYTWPEVAAVGKTEEELKEAGVAYKSGSFPMRALGRSRASGDIDGVVKVLADQATDEVLGVHIVAARAADIIMEAVTAMEFRASAEDIARICHGHPTYTEALKEAALAATANRAIHS